jgi:hypothetical protein
MLQKLKTLLTVSLVGTLMGTALLVPAIASAAGQTCGNNISTNIESGVTSATGGTATCDTSQSTGVTSGIERIAKDAVDIFSIIVGVAAVIMIIYGGFRYITSGGDSGKVGNAKNTLVYAIVGLVIVALAQLIVHYVLTESNSVNSSTSTGSIYLQIPRRDTTL